MRIPFILVVVLVLLLVWTAFVRSDGFVNVPVRSPPAPPHAYTNPKSAYSNEDIAALIDTLRKELTRYHQEIPEAVATTIQDQLEPTIKGVLSRNYYVPQ